MIFQVTEMGINNLLFEWVTLLWWWSLWHKLELFEIIVVENKWIKAMVVFWYVLCWWCCFVYEFCVSSLLTRHWLAFLCSLSERKALSQVIDLHWFGEGSGGAGGGGSSSLRHMKLVSCGTRKSFKVRSSEG